MSVVRIQSSLIGGDLRLQQPALADRQLGAGVRVDDAQFGIGQRPADAVAFGRAELAVHVGCPSTERPGEFGCAVSQLDRNAVAGLELVSGLRIKRTRRADQEIQRGQVFLGDVGIEQHADDGGLHARTFDAVRLHRVHPAVDGEPLEDDDPPAVVGARDQLTDPDAAELPVREFGRGARRGGLAAGDAEDGAFQHPRLDRLPLGRAGGAAGQDLQCHTGFRPRHGRGCRRGARAPERRRRWACAIERATPALPARLAAAMTSPVQSSSSATIADRPQRLDVAADRLR